TGSTQWTDIAHCKRPALHLMYGEFTGLRFFSQRFHFCMNMTDTFFFYMFDYRNQQPFLRICRYPNVVMVMETDSVILSIEFTIHHWKLPKCKGQRFHKKSSYTD